MNLKNDVEIRQSDRVGLCGWMLYKCDVYTYYDLYCLNEAYIYHMNLSSSCRMIDENRYKGRHLC